jgi:hypothetical protein
MRQRNRRGSLRARRRIAAACLAGCLLIAGAALAQADPIAPGVPVDQPTASDDPTTGVVPTVINSNPCYAANEAAKATVADCNTTDTDYTPVAKPADTSLFQRVGGANFGENHVPGTSFTPITVDFYAVRFLDQNNGFAGGAACKNENATFDELKDCTRVPVIWQYTNKRGEGQLWREVYRGDTEGFVAAIAYYGRGKAMAVGGSGKYPYREFSSDSTSNPDDDKSGKGRVWEVNLQKYDDSDWHEYGADQKPTAPNLPADIGPANPGQTAQAAIGSCGGQVPQSTCQTATSPITGTGAVPEPDPVATPMRALTALDCSQVEAFCVAGGIQQLFMWHSGRFDKSYGNGSRDDVAGSGVVSDANRDANQALGDTEMRGAINFRFRVRSLGMLPGDHGAGQIHVAGVTAGCCDKNPANNLPRLVLWDGSHWFVRGIYDIVADHAPQTLPDSYYSLAPIDPRTASLVATSGGPEQRIEPASRVVGSVVADCVGDCGPATALSLGTSCNRTALDASGGCTDLAHEGLHPELSDFRLVAGDGDASGVPSSSAHLDGSTIGTGSSGPGPDGFIDWAVGEQRSTHQALAYTTLAKPNRLNAPSPINCETAKADQTCKPASQDEIQDRTVSHSYFLLPSYRLNAFTMVGTTGTGWAAGDKGALVRIGGSGDDSGVAPEPKPPKVGPPRAATNPGSSYASDHGLSQSPGRLPVLGDDTGKSAGYQIVAAGSPQTYRYANLHHDDVSSIVMSRDGSEGWALGSGVSPSGSGCCKGRTTLYHYSGGRWSVCDPQGIPEEVAPDEACASLLPLYRGSKDFDPVRILTAARVPLENDDDPANDNEFEVMAIGTVYLPSHSSLKSPAPAVLIYKDGRWSVDERQMGAIPWGGSTTTTQQIGGGLSLAFAAPNDGWLLLQGFHDVFHFDGHGWRECNPPPPGQRAPACGDDAAAPVLPDSFPTGGGGVAGATAGSPEFFQVVGERVYLFGGAHWNGGPIYPIIIYKDPGGHWTDGSGPGGDGMGYDPGCTSRDGKDTNGDGKPDPGNCIAADSKAPQGTISSFSVVTNRDGSLSGWASGYTKTSPVLQSVVGTVGGSTKIGSEAGFMLHLEKSDSGHAWRVWSADDASHDYPEELFKSVDSPAHLSPEMLALPGDHGDGPAVLWPSTTDAESDGPALLFDPARSRWEVMPTPFELAQNDRVSYQAQARARVIAPDGKGGAWLSIRRTGNERGFDTTIPAPPTFFYHYTNEVPKPVFADAPNPAGAKLITGATGGGDGSFWLSTNSGTVYRYDRVLGWEALAIPNWDPGRIVARTSSANAIAIGSDGRGVVVGEGGRIADVGPDGVILDQAAGRSCAAGQAPPCGTGRGLTAAAISPKGAAMIGGEFRTVLWRPSGGSFRTVQKPPAALTATITGVSMPDEDRAWLCDDHGEVFEGELHGEDWTWKLENDTPDGAILNQSLQTFNGEAGSDVRLRAIALDAEGRGYAVGEKGLVLERDGDSANPWHRVGDVPVSAYTAVAVSPAGFGAGAMIGGEYGFVLTRAGGGLAVAHQADPFDGVNTSDQGRDIGASWVSGMALVPGSQAGELEAWVAEQLNPEVAARRTPSPNALLHYSSDPGDPLLDGAGPRATALDDSLPRQAGELRLAAFGKSECIEAWASCPPPTGTMRENDRILAGVRAGIVGESVHAALSTGDSVQTATVDRHQIGSIAGFDSYGFPGTNTLTTGEVKSPIVNDEIKPSIVHRDWEESFARPLLDSGTPLFGAIGGQDLARLQNSLLPHAQGTNLGWRQALADMPYPWGADKTKTEQANGITWQPVEDTSKKTATDETQAHTHYAVDGVKDGNKVVRLVVADTSRGSLSASDPLQNPPETQAAWLDKVLCIKGSQTDTGNCTRDSEERAVLVTNTPTYSYGPGGITDTNQDSAAIESLVFTDQVTAVIQGKLGWNGLYWSCQQCAPPHTPTPGGSYPAGPPPAPAGQSPIPFVIASSAGGAFAQDAQDTSASNGYWHGYTVVRLSPDGDPAKTIVEQRPILDWLLIEGKSHMLRPGQSLKLDGFGREPMSTDGPFRYDDISSPAITHRYDLIYADPEKPWLPKQGSVADTCDPYDCLPGSIGTIDDQTGAVKAVSGAQERTYALALLSVGKLSTTYPISFEPRPSFRQAPAPPPLPIPPAATPPAAPAPPAPAPPFNPPTLATPPPLAPLPAQTPPAPPVPPAPPNGGPAQLDLFTSPPVLSVAPTVSLFPPSAPVINVAPPTPARPVEKAKKVAVQSSGSDSDAPAKGREAVDIASDHGAERPNAATRHENNFTALAHRDQASAWARDLQWGGGLTLMALVAAFGWITVRPTPRRRTPEVPAPSWSRNRR